MRHLLRVLLLSCWAAFAQSPAGTTSPDSAASHVYVEPWKTLIHDTISVKAGQALQYNFGLTRGTRLSAQFQVTGGLNNTIEVLLLDQVNYQRRAARQRFVVIKGASSEVRGVGRYTFIVPQTGIYYVVLDNGRAWMMPRNVALHLYAVLPEATPESAEAQATFEKLYAGLRRAFEFPDFKISVRHCGVVNAFSNPNITLCSELLDELARQNLPGAIEFVLLHELGHTLLRGWGLPLWDNEDAADEFATVFMMMFKQQQGALQAAQYWASQGASTADAVAKIYMDDRHSLSPQRARNVIRWLNSGQELIPRWQKQLVPNMKTALLQELLRNPEGFDREQVRAELSRRAVPTSSPVAATDVLPTVVGQCTTTTVSKIGTRLTDGGTGRDIAGSGSLISYADGGGQVSYETVSGIQHSRVGDKVFLCLVSIPTACPPGDDRGKWYAAKNLRTGDTWRLPNSQHSCGGA